MNEFASSGNVSDLSQHDANLLFTPSNKRKPRERRELKLRKETAEVQTHFEFLQSQLIHNIHRKCSKKLSARHCCTRAPTLLCFHFSRIIFLNTFSIEHKKVLLNAKSKRCSQMTVKIGNVFLEKINIFPLNIRVRQIFEESCVIELNRADAVEPRAIFSILENSNNSSKIYRMKFSIGSRGNLAKRSRGHARKHRIFLFGN